MYLLKRQSNKDGQIDISSICWFTSHMTSIARAGSAGSQEPGPRAWSPAGVERHKDWVHQPWPSFTPDGYRSTRHSLWSPSDGCWARAVSDRVLDHTFSAKSEFQDTLAQIHPWRYTSRGCPPSSVQKIVHSTDMSLHLPWGDATKESSWTTLGGVRCLGLERTFSGLSLLSSVFPRLLSMLHMWLRVRGTPSHRRLSQGHC